MRRGIFPCIGREYWPVGPYPNESGDGVAQTDRIRQFERQILVHLDDLYRAASRLTGNASDAEDLVQETCVRAFRCLDQLRFPGAAKAWVFSILRSIFLRDIE